MNVMKRNKIQSRLKGWVQTIFQTLLPNFDKGLMESCQKIVLLDESEQNGPKQLLGYPPKFGHTA